MKKSIRWIPVLALFVAVFLFAFGTALADSEGDYTYRIKNDGAVITGYTGSDTEITIPSFIAGYPVTEIDFYAFGNKDNIVSVVFPEGVTTIHDFAFDTCANLREISLPASIQSIHVEAFIDSCIQTVHYAGSIADINNITVMDSDISILLDPNNELAYANWICSDGEYRRESFDGSLGNDIAWSYNLSDRSFSITGTGPMPDIEPGNWPWSNTPMLYRANSIEIGTGITSIGPYAFLSSRSLTIVTLPGTLKSVSENAFENCRKLTDIYYSGTEAEWNAISFSDGNKYLIKSAIHIGESIFYMTLGSGTCGANDDNLTWTLKGPGVLTVSGTGEMNNYNDPFEAPWYDNEMYELITSIVIEPGVTHIGDYAFTGCNYVRSLSLPEGLLSIGDGAFGDNERITELHLPNTLTTLGISCFNGMGNLAEVTIPGSVTEVPIEMFSGSEGLRHLTLSDGITKIGASAFKNCENLESIIIPVSVTSIDSGAFFGCTSLSDIYYSGTEADWAGITICENNDPLTSDKVHYNYTPAAEIIASGTCGADGDNLAWTLDSTGLLTIDGNGEMGSFETAPWNSYKDAVSTITLGSGIASISNSAFSDCSLLSSVSVPDSVVSIGDNAFSGCSSLTDVYYSGTATEWNAITVGSGNECLIGATIHIILASGTCGDNLTWTLDGNYSLTISGTGDMTDYNSINVPWYNNREYITSIKINDSVTSIGEWAFWYCTGLTNVTIGNRVTSIGDWAFGNCTSLESITIGNGVTSIGERAFWKCTSLTNIAIPNSVTNIGNSVFCECTSLTGVTIGNSVDYIGQGAFEGCFSLSSIAIPDSVSYIEFHAFYGCAGLSNVTIGSGVTNIGETAFVGCSSLMSFDVDNNNQLYSSEGGVLFNKNKTHLITCPGGYSGNYSIPDGTIYILVHAFEDCTSLTGVTVPDSVTSIASGAFSGCSGLMSFDVDGNNTVYSSEGGILFNKEQTTLIACPGGFSGSYTIPDSVTDINSYAFEKCTGLTSVFITNGVTNTGYGTFIDCTNLTAVTIPGSVTTIDDWAFFRCSNLSDITIPGSVTSIGEDAFGYCSSLTGITIPDSVTSIGERAFESSGLTSINIGNGVSSIVDYAFASCTGLTDVYYAGTEAEWNEIAIESGNEYLTGAAIHYILASGTCGDGLTWTLDSDGLLTISGTGAMEDYEPNELPWYSYCEDIISVVISEGVTTIGDSAFYNCISLTSITIPDNVTSIGDSAFANCDRLASITIPNSVTSIGNNVFSYCSGLTSIIIPDGVTSIGYYAFYQCAGLTSITIPDSVISIGSYAFSGCSSLTDIILPDSVTSIGDNAFSGCSNLTNITIPDGIASINNQTFTDCGSLTCITIPSSVTSIGVYAFPNCSSLTDVCYTGTEAEWNAITKGDGNNSLTSAAIHYNYTPLVWSLSENGVLTIRGTGPMGVGIWSEAPWYSHREEIVSAVIEEGITSICNVAFCNCSNLTSVTIPSSVTSIGSEAFEGCSSLTNITLPDSVTSISEWAFACSNLTSIALPDGISSISSCVFWGCTNLASVTIPDSVTSICYGAFSDCTGLTDVYYAGTETEWNTIYFEEDNECLTNATVHYNTLAHGTCGDGLTWILDNDGLLTVSGTGAMASDPSWWKYRDSISAAVIEDGITNISAYAFCDCSRLSSISIPDSVVLIGDSAFSNCTGLTSIIIPDSVTRFGFGAFEGCSNLTQLNMPSQLTDLGEKAFYGCSSLTSIDIPATVTRIGFEAFAGTSITEITLPEGVLVDFTGLFEDCTFLQRVVLPEEFECLSGLNVAFLGCGSLTEIVIPENNNQFCTIDGVVYNKAGTQLILCPAGLTGTVSLKNGVETIGFYAFHGCTHIDAVCIPSSVTSIIGSAFSGCTGLTDVYYTGTEEEWNEISIESNNEYLTGAEKHFNYIPVIASGTCGDDVTWTLYEDGTLIISGTGAMTDYGYENKPWGYNEVIRTLIIEEGVTHIGDTAFSFSQNLTAVTLPESLTSIGNAAFIMSQSLTGITLPENLTSIGDRTFISCSGITELNIPAHVSYIGLSALNFGENSSAVITVSAGNPYYTVVNGILYNADITELIVCPTSVEGAVIVPDTVNSIAYCAFAYSKIQSVTIPDSVVSIGQYAFEASGQLTSVTLPSGLTILDVGLFNKCIGLNSITLPDSVTTIEASAFNHCTNLNSITLPSSLTTVGKGAFRECTSLTNIYFKGTNTQWYAVSVGAENEYLFNANVEFAELPSNITWEYDETSHTLTISGTGPMTDYEYNTSPWYDLKDAITSVVLTDGVTSVGNYSFEDCDNLTSVILPAGLTRIGSFAFAGCDNLTGIDLPAGLTYIDNGAFEYCSAFTGIVIPSGVTEIGEEAFGYCHSLVSVTLPDGLTEIGELAFYHSGLQNIIIPTGVQTKEWTFYSISEDFTRDVVYKAYLPASVTSVRNSFWATHLSEIHPDFAVPSALQTIESEAFSGISASFVWLSDNTTTIGSKAFANCSNLQYVRIPAGCSSIAADAFPKSTILLIPESDSYIEDFAEDNGYEYIREFLGGGNG